MIIAIPTTGEAGIHAIPEEHFGRCSTFILLDEHGTIAGKIDNTSRHMGGSGLPPELLAKHKVDVLLCKGLGPSAISLCSQHGIKVFMADGKTAGEMFEQFRQGKAAQAGMQDACQDHRH